MNVMKRPWLRPVLVVLAIVVWVGVGGAGGSTFGKLSEVQQNDNAAFLPSSAESTKAAQANAQFIPQTEVPALFVVDGIASDADVAAVRAFADAVAAAPIQGDTGGRTVGDTLTAAPAVIPSEDGQAVLVTLTIDSTAFEEPLAEGRLGTLIATTIKTTWAAQELDSLIGYLTGAVGFVADLTEAFAGIDGILLLVALGVVLVILLIVYRSPVLPFLVLITSMIALTAAIIVVYGFAKAGVIELNGQSQGIMFILVVGAATDYSLLLVARYREELLHERSTYAALARAWRRSLEPIAASAGTVVAGLLVLLLSDLKSLSALGPAGAVGIIAALFATLTLLPALLLIGGKHARGVFWPAMPRFVGDGDDARSVDAIESRYGVWGTVARRVNARPRVVWLGAAALLLGLSAFLPMLNAGGLGDQDYFLKKVDSTKGFSVLEQHFAAGASSPIRIIAPQVDGDAVLAAAQAVDGIDSAYYLTPSVANGAPPGASQEPPMVIDGKVEVVAVTAVSSTSVQATDIVADVRGAVHMASPDALVGGSAAESLDTRLTTDRDIRVIIPAVLLVIFVVLSLLLRALIAPALIVLANILSFGAALGLSALVFTHAFHFPGVDPGTPLLGFVFLVALGVDYSIFLMSRAREESLRYGTREGVRRALAVTGGVITSAGIVLAATFAALAVIPLIFLAQIAFIVSVGVLIDTFIVRSLLVPGLITDVDRRSWAPWHASIDN